MNLARIRDLLMTRQGRLGILVTILALLGTIALRHGARATGVAMFVLAIAMVAAFVLLVVRPARIPRDAVVQIRLAGRIREYAPRSILDQVIGRAFPTLFHLRQALEAAAGDEKTRALIVEIAGFDPGLATACELHDLIKAVRDSGKRVVAVLAGDTTRVRDYLVACGATEVVANPDTMVAMLGVAAGGLFLKGAMRKAGVDAQTLQWKEYKGAAEMFSREEMSPALRESLAAIVSDWQSAIADKVGAARKLDRDRARDLLGAGFLSASAAREAGLFDRIGHIEDIHAELDPGGKHRKFVGLARYLRHIAYAAGRGARPRIALVHATGPVVAGEQPPGGEFLHGATVAADLIRASRDKRVRAIVMRVNSPGGSAVGSELVWRGVREAQRNGKPVVVSMGDVAGSGGYYIAAGADAIVAEPTTLTGSIGVVFARFNLRDLMAQLGIRIEYAGSDATSDAMSPARPLTEPELAQLNKTLGEMYETFKSKVSEGRKLGGERTEEIARGRVWSGVSARQNGLVDDLGGLGRAIQLAREKAGIRPDQMHELAPLPPPRLIRPLSFALSPADTSWMSALAAEAIGAPDDWAPALIRLLLRSTALLLCPILPD